MSLARRALALPALLVLASAVTGPASADPLPTTSKRVVDYRIDVRLDPAAKQLTGREQVTWRNPSTDTVGEAWFHLYLNAFRNNRSTFARESGRQLRGDEQGENNWGWTEVTSLRLAGGADLTGAMRFEHPDDDNADDRTVVRVPLPQPVPPGGSATFEITFKAQLPKVFARSGYVRDYFFVGQWFPKLGVYEPAGLRGRAAGGWNCHQYHANSEFYADFGTFHVEITVPPAFVVGATGEPRGRRSNPDGTTTHIFEQADVHDFAWTADPSFVRVRHAFSATRDVSPAEYARLGQLLNRSREEMTLGDVEIVVLMQPAHMPQVGRYVQAAKAAIKWFGLWYGRYPYKTLTVVDPPQDGSGSGGMEYPTLITAGTAYLMNYWPFSLVREPELVTIHEFGHQFWYGLVANNEFEEAWLDEGVNTYSTGLVTDAEYGADSSYGQIWMMKLGELDTYQAAISPTTKDRIVKPAWMYAGDYSFYAYTKPAIVLRTLQGYLGKETMARVMRTYHERWRFGHPSSRDFFAVASEVAGKDLSWFLEPAFLGSDALDYAVDAVSSRPVEPRAGVFEENGRRVVLEPKEEGAKPGGQTQYESRVLVRRIGEVVFPVDIALKFKGRQAVHVAWDGADRFKRLVIVRPEPLEWAAVDRWRRVTLDADWLNNSKRVDPDNRLTLWWSARWLSLLQQVVSLLGL